jgi:hypothetical protein
MAARLRAGRGALVAVADLTDLELSEFIAQGQRDGRHMTIEASVEASVEGAHEGAHEGEEPDDVCEGSPG